jgi:hypothetical protein
MPDNQLSPDDAIAQLRKLPEDKQRLVLSRLSPDVRRGILAKLSAPAVASPSAPLPSAVDEPVTPEELKAHPIAGHAANFGGGAVKGLEQLFLHPIDTLVIGPEKQLEDIMPSYRMVNGVPIPVPNTEGIQHGIDTAKAAKDQPLYTAGQAVGGLEGAHAVGEVVGPVTRGLKATAEAARNATQSMVGAGERQVKPMVAKEAESAADAAEKTRAANKESDEETLKARGKVDTVNKEAKTKAIADTREAQAKHEADTAAAKAENDRVLTARKQRVEAQKKLDDASAEMRARIETAREKALRVGNQKYNTLNEKLNPVPADNEAVFNTFNEASGKIKGSETEPAILKDIGKKVELGDGFTYEDLQGYYSELGTELSKGTLQSDVYTALDKMHEGIGEEMQRIADSQGEGESLAAARNYWRRMKQTFGKPWNQNDNATAALKTANPDFLKSDELQNRLRLLGSFDKQLPKVAENVQNLRKGLDDLGPEKPLREEVKQLPENPAPIKPAVKPYAEPKGTKPIETPEVSTRQLREKLVDKWASGESSLNKWQVRALLSGGLGSLVGLALGGAEGVEAAGAVTAATYAFGPAMVAKLLDNAGVREWLTRPPEGELETLRKLPNADRIRITDGLKPVVAAAQKQGISVSPAIIGMVGTASVVGPQTKKLQDLRDQRSTAPVQ